MTVPSHQQHATTRRLPIRRDLHRHVSPRNTRLSTHNLYPYNQKHTERHKLNAATRTPGPSAQPAPPLLINSMASPFTATYRFPVDLDRGDLYSIHIPEYSKLKNDGITSLDLEVDAPPDKIREMALLFRLTSTKVGYAFGEVDCRRCGTATVVTTRNHRAGEELVSVYPEIAPDPKACFLPKVYEWSVYALAKALPGMSTHAIDYDQMRAFYARLLTLFLVFQRLTPENPNYVAGSLPFLPKEMILLILSFMKHPLATHTPCLCQFNWHLYTKKAHDNYIV